MKPKLNLKAIIRMAVLMAAVFVTVACGWLTYSEYQFAQGTSDLRVMWWSLVVGALFVAAVVGGLVGLYRFISGLRKGTAPGWQGLSPKGLAGLSALAAAAVVCCYLAVGADGADRHTQLGGIEPAKITTLWVDRGGNVVKVDPGHRGSAPTGLLAYWFPGLTGALSAWLTWRLSELVRRP